MASPAQPPLEPPRGATHSTPNPTMPSPPETHPSQPPYQKPARSGTASDLTTEAVDSLGVDHVTSLGRLNALLAVPAARF